MKAAAQAALKHAIRDELHAQHHAADSHSGQGPIAAAAPRAAERSIPRTPHCLTGFAEGTPEHAARLNELIASEEAGREGRAAERRKLAEEERAVHSLAAERAVTAVRQAAAYPNPHAPLAILKSADYMVHIVASAIRPNDSSTGQVLVLELELLAEGLRGRLIRHEIIVQDCQSGEAQREGQAELSALKCAVGIYGAIADSSELHGKPFTVRVRTIGGTHHGRDHGPRMNVITDFNPKPTSRTRLVAPQGDGLVASASARTASADARAAMRAETQGLDAATAEGCP